MSAADTEREALARLVYEASPFYESGEYVDGFAVSPGGNLSWDQAVARDAEFAGDRLFLPVTADAYRSADALLAAGYTRTPPEQPSPHPPRTDGGEEQSWRCFHCGEVFTTERCARNHFGDNEDSKPACKIKAGAEGSLVEALRTAESECADAWSLIHSEGTEAAQAYYRQSSRHSQQLRAAEEAGYEKGLRDGIEEAARRRCADAPAGGEAS